MTRPWRLTRTAETSLIEIARWTLATFGPRQAEASENDLIDVCNKIAAGTAISRDCRRLIDPDLDEDLRFARCGQHFIVFVESATQVIVIDFVHTRSDLPGRLAALSDARTGGPS